MTDIRNTARGLESSNSTAIPGAYPTSTDDVSGQSAALAAASQAWDHNEKSSSTRNKLHKPNDPRGWDTDKTPRSHQHTDSGVGIGENLKDLGYNNDNNNNAYSDNYRSTESGRNVSDDLSSRRQEPIGATSTYQSISEPQRQAEPQTTRTYDDKNISNNNWIAGSAAGTDYDYTTSRQEEPRDTRANDNNNSSSLLAAGVTGSEYTNREGTQADMGPTSQNHAAGVEKASEEHPYWGDLPRGGGVYNTVIGHGSQEDGSQQGYHGTQATAGSETTRAQQQPMTTTDSGYNTSQQRAFPLAGGVYGSEQSQREPQDLSQQKDDTRQREVRDAAVAGTAAAAAYPLVSEEEKKRERKQAEKEQQKLEKEREKQLQKEQKEAQKDQKESKIHALFHRDSDKKEKEKPAKEEKQKKEHGHKDKDRYDETVVVAPASTRRAQEDQSQYQDLSRSTEQFQIPDNRQSESQAKNSHFKEGLGLGAAGAAAYGASKYVDEDKNKSDNAAYSTSDRAAYNPAQASQTSRSRAPNHIDSSSGDTRYNILPSGTASGVKNGDDADAGMATASSTRTEQPMTSDNSGMPRSAAFVGGASRYEEPSSTVSRYQEQPAAASQYQQPASTRYEEYSTVNTTKYDQPRSSKVTEPTRAAEERAQPTKADEVPRESRANEYEAVAAGAAATAGAGALAYKAHESQPKYESATGLSSSSAAPATTGKRSAAPSSHHHDQYNHLASGTPSGINLEHN